MKFNTGSPFLLTLAFAIGAAQAQPHQFQLARQFGPALGVESDIVNASASRGGFHVVVGNTTGALAGETSAGASDVFVRKYDEAGAVIWTRQFGSAADDRATGVTIDSSGNVIVAGSTCGALPGQVSAGDCDVFLRKYDTSGNALWTRQLGTSGAEFSGKVAVDVAGNISIAGTTRGSFPGFTISGFNDAFVARFDAAGNQLGLRQIGTTGSDQASGIGIDAAGAIVVCGGAGGALPGQVFLGGGSDGFLMKLNTDLTTVWTAQFGGAGAEFCSDLAIEPAGGIYAVLSGALRQYRQFSSAGTQISAFGIGVEIDGIAADATGVTIVGFSSVATLDGKPSSGSNDVYVRRNQLNGTFIWSDYFGTTESETGLAVSANGSSVFIGGVTNGVLPGKTPSGFNDGFARKYSLAGVEQWTDQFGSLGPATSFGSAVHVTASRIHTAGRTNGAMPGATHFGDSDGYLSTHDLNGNLLWIRQFGSTVFDTASAVGSDASGSLYVAGFTTGVLPGAARTGTTDAYLKKFDANGTELWSRQFGTSTNGQARVEALVVEPGGDVYVAGQAILAFPGQSNAGSIDAFVRKYNAAGAEVWTRQFGTSSDDYALGIALDGAGGVVAVGSTSGGTFPGQLKVGNSDAFVARFDAGTGIPTWLSQLGSSAGQIASLHTVTVASDGSIYAVGENTGTYPGQVSSGGTFDVSLAKLTSAGSQAWIRQFGSSGDDRGVGVAIDPSGNISVVCSFGNTAVSDTAIRRFSSTGSALGSLVQTTPNTDLTFAGAGNADGILVATGYTQSALAGQTQFGETDVFIKKFLPPNAAPTVAASAASVAVNEGAVASNTGTFADQNSADVVTLSASFGTIAKTGVGTWSWSWAAVEGPAAPIVTITANDGNGGITTTTFQVNIANLPPVLGAATGPSAAIPVGTSVTIVAPVSDPGILDPISCRFNWDDGSADTITSGACSAAHTYSTPGVYGVTITASDDDGGSAATRYEFVLVYDPSAGFVTGGGWINSPAGAYIANPSLTGKGTFGFVARYQRGASLPSGQTEFHLQAGNFRFDSTSYEWLVVAGSRAQFRGSGEVNGVAGFGFLITVADGPDDRFRIKIWRKATATTPETAVYDNALGFPDTIDGANPQAIGGGSIQIQSR